MIRHRFQLDFPHEVSLMLSLPVTTESLFFPCTTELDGNDLLSYWPALEECEARTLQKWGSERPLGADYSKDAANNNQLDAALTSGDENGLTQPHRHRKGERHMWTTRHSWKGTHTL